MFPGENTAGDGVTAAGGQVTEQTSTEATEPNEATAAEVTSQTQENQQQQQTEVKDAPWSGDLRSALEGAEDPFVAADTYMREKVQPRITELEQQIAGSKDAIDLYNDLTTNTLEAHYNITAAIFGDEVAQKFAEFLDAEGEEPFTPGDFESDETQQVERDPEVQALIDKHNQEEAARAYNELVEQVKGRDDIDAENFDDAVFANAVIMTNGDVEQAVAQYKAWEQRFAERFGQTNTEQQQAQPVPVIGSDTTTQAQPTQGKEYKTWGDLDDALDDFTAETTRKAAPPTVGSV